MSNKPYDILAFLLVLSAIVVGSAGILVFSSMAPTAPAHQANGPGIRFSIRINGSATYPTYYAAPGQTLVLFLQISADSEVSLNLSAASQVVSDSLSGNSISVQLSAYHVTAPASGI